MYTQIAQLDYFKSLVANADQIPLFEAAASLAQDEYLTLDLESVQSALDVLSKRLNARCKNASTEMRRLHEMVDFFFREMKFAGNFDHYYVADNSYVHRVLETKRGIPISLAVVFIELAQGIGLDAHGISFPGHFLVGVQLHQGQVVLDPCSGKSFSSDELLERLEPFRAQLGLRAGDMVGLKELLRPATHSEILLRMLRNLYELFQNHGDAQRLDQVRQRMGFLQIQSSSS
jgi:regulator of sirC expression with transglutaminase-like and TPR domain